MNYCLNPNLQMRDEAFGKILYNRFGMLSFVDHETSGFLDLLKIGPQSLEMLTQKCPEKSKNKLYEFIIWSLKKGYVNVTNAIFGGQEKPKHVIFRKNKVDYYQRFSAPLTATIYPEYRCNQHCYFCFAQENMHKNKKTMNSLEWQKIINQCIQAKVTRLVILGGEPFMNQELLMDIIREASPYMPITVFTNGSARNGITSEDAHLLAGYPNVDLVFSIHSSNMQNHDKITGLPGSFVKALQSMRNVCKEGKNIVSVNCVMTRQNMNDVLNLAKIVESIGVQGFAFSPANPCGIEGFQDDSLSPAEILEVFYKVEEWKNKGMNLDITCDIPFATGAKPLTSSYSGEIPQMACKPCIGDINMIIDSDGDLYACNGVVGDEHYCIGNIKTYSIEKMWSQYEWPLSRRNEEINSVCSTCERYKYCYGGCPLLSIETYGGNRYGNPLCIKMNN